MRTIVLTATMLALGAVACSSGGSKSANTDDFSADLKLASATTMDLAAPKVNQALLTSLETAPHSAPERAPVIKKAPEGDRVVQSEAPTVAAEPEPTPAAEQEVEPVATVVAPAPVPEESTEPVAVAPRPTPAATVPAGGRGAGDYGTGGGVFGGGIGVVIRGGGVGDDHCVPRRRGGTGIYTGGIFVPRPTAPVAGGTVVRPRVVRVAVSPR
jgi:hypothetical protein